MLSPVPVHFPEFPGIVKEEDRFIPESDDRSQEAEPGWLFFCFPNELSAHPEVDEENASIVQGDDDKFRPAGNGADSFSDQIFSKFSRDKSAPVRARLRFGPEFLEDFKILTAQDF